MINLTHDPKKLFGPISLVQKVLGVITLTVPTQTKPLTLILTHILSGVNLGILNWGCNIFLFANIRLFFRTVGANPMHQ